MLISAPRISISYSLKSDSRARSKVAFFPELFDSAPFELRAYIHLTPMLTSLNAHVKRQLLRFLDQGSQADGNAVPPEGLVSRIQTERCEQFHDVLGGPRTQQVQVKRFKPCSESLALRIET